jgi:hypothetical protein
MKGYVIDPDFDFDTITSNCSMRAVLYLYEITHEYPEPDNTPVNAQSFLESKRKRLTEERKKENRGRIKPWEKEKAFR